MIYKYRGTPKSSILVGFSIINQPFGGTPIYGNLHIASRPLIFRNDNPLVPLKSASGFLKIADDMILDPISNRMKPDCCSSKDTH